MRPASPAGEAEPPTGGDQDIPEEPRVCQPPPNVPADDVPTSASRGIVATGCCALMAM